MALNSTLAEFAQSLADHHWLLASPLAQMKLLAPQIAYSFEQNQALLPRLYSL